jgi:hypothetical protein
VKSEPSVCAGFNKDGRRCGNKTSNGYCYLHENQEEKGGSSKVPAASASVSDVASQPESDGYCAGVTLEGKPCSKKTSNTSGFCYLHGDQALSGSSTKDKHKTTSDEAKTAPMAADLKCLGVTKNGDSCSRTTTNSNRYCFQHQDQYEKSGDFKGPAGKAAGDSDARTSLHSDDDSCAGFTKEGKPCRNKSGNASDFCYLHGDQDLLHTYPKLSTKEPLGFCISAPGKNLETCESDCGHVTTMLIAKSVQFPFQTLLCDTRDRTSKIEVVKQLADFFGIDSDLYILYYSGHGEPGEAGEELGGRTGGALCIGRSTLTFEDLKRVWTQSKREFPRRGRRLLVIADSCFSGKLVSKLRNLSRDEQTDLNIAIQSAGNARQTVTEEKGFVHGGYEFEAGRFTAYWTSKQTKTVKWTASEQHPQFYATWDYTSCDVSKFEVPLGGRSSLTMYAHPDNK